MGRGPAVACGARRSSAPRPACSPAAASTACPSTTSAPPSACPAPGLYRHFPGKEAMLAEMLLRISQQLLDEGSRRAVAAPDARSRPRRPAALAHRLRAQPARAHHRAGPRARQRARARPQRDPPPAASLRRGVGHRLVRAVPRHAAGPAARRHPCRVRAAQLHPAQCLRHANRGAWPQLLYTMAHAALTAAATPSHPKARRLRSGHAGSATYGRSRSRKSGQDPGSSRPGWPTTPPPGLAGPGPASRTR